MSKKYKLTQDTISHSGKILHKIKALKDFGYIKKGDFGGYIEKESNLSHEGDCWVYDNALVYSNAHVYGNALVSGYAFVSGYALVSGYAQVSDHARISGNALVYGDARVYGKAFVSGNAHVSGNAQISGDAHVSGNAHVTDYAQVSDYALVTDNAHVTDNALVYENAHVYGNAHLKNFDEISKTEHYFSILGFKYPITVTPTSVNISCMSFTFDMLDQKIRHEGFSQDDILMIKMMVEIALNKILENI
jgi:carbonic anhydrase/acetyltransferase-like protein (isoleucine patch superfamily)